MRAVIEMLNEQLDEQSEMDADYYVEHLAGKSLPPASPGAGVDLTTAAVADARGDHIRALEACLSVSAVRFSQLAGELDRLGADAMAVLARVYQQQISDALEEARALASSAQRGGAGS